MAVRGRKPRETSKTMMFTMRLDRDMRDRLRECANRMGMSYGAFVRAGIEWMLEQNKADRA